MENINCLKEKLAKLEEEILNLKKDKEFYKNIVDNINICMHINEIKEDKYFDVIWVNEFYKKTVKIKKEERNKDTESYYKEYYSDNDVKMVENAIQAIQKNKKEAYSAVYNYKSKYNESSWMYTIGTPYKYSDTGDLEQILCASIDLTGKIFNPERYFIKLTPINPTFKAQKNHLESKITMENYQDFQLAKDFRELGYTTLISIGEWEENQIGSNCGQFATQYHQGQVIIKENYTCEDYIL